MGKRVLIIDDDPVVRSLLSEFLEASGHTVETADGGSVALARISAQSLEFPEVIMLDMLMPDINGLDVLRSLKSNPRTSLVPVIMLSANTASEASQLLKNARLSAQCFLQKPFDFKLLTDVLTQLDRPEAD